jgi:Lrp/AsnC family leucine-responsive transcriptional regulator
MTAIDDTDRQILGLVQRDAKLPHAEIGRRVGLSVSAVNERLRKLQAAGVIRAYEARLDPQALGLELCAFVLVQLERPEHEAPFLEAVRATRQVLECHHVTGDYNYLLKLRVARPTELEAVIGRGLKGLAGVVRTHTVIALSTAKETLALDLRGARGGD